jgi:hypothetical protein
VIGIGRHKRIKVSLPLYKCGERDLWDEVLSSKFKQTLACLGKIAIQQSKLEFIGSIPCTYCEPILSKSDLNLAKLKFDISKERFFSA